MRKRANLLVLGAGVSGLSCARELLERGHAVTLWARELPLETTSAVAAALWYPFEAGPPERVAGWAGRSYERFLELEGAGVPGVRLQTVLDLRSPAQDPPAWLPVLGAFRALAPDERQGFEQGWSACVPVIEMPLYLPWLSASVRELGGVLERRTVETLDETRAFDGVLNCTGLGARVLCGDDRCHPIRGQVVRVERGAVERGLLFERGPGDFGYVVPRSRDCVLGGTTERGVESLAVDAEVTRSIVARCARLEPRLSAVVREAAVGLRPGRDAIRLEREALPGGRALVHDYGHGGCGVTLSWACAEEAVGLLEEALA